MTDQVDGGEGKAQQTALQRVVLRVRGQRLPHADPADCGVAGELGLQLHSTSSALWGTHISYISPTTTQYTVQWRAVVLT